MLGINAEPSNQELSDLFIFGKDWGLEFAVLQLETIWSNWFICDEDLIHGGTGLSGANRNPERAATDLPVWAQSNSWKGVRWEHLCRHWSTDSALVCMSTSEAVNTVLVWPRGQCPRVVGNTEPVRHQRLGTRSLLAARGKLGAAFGPNIEIYIFICRGRGNAPLLVHLNLWAVANLVFSTFRPIAVVHR